MGKVKQRLEGHSKIERAKNRQALGTLRELTVQPQTRKRYSLAKQKFYDYTHSNNLTIPTKFSAFDDMLADYVEHLWSVGEGRALASDTVAGFQDTEPSTPGHLEIVEDVARQRTPESRSPSPGGMLVCHAGMVSFP